MVPLALHRRDRLPSGGPGGDTPLSRFTGRAARCGAVGAGPPLPRSAAGMRTAGRPLTPLSYAKYVRGGAGAGRAEPRRHGAARPGAAAAAAATAAQGGRRVPPAGGQRPLKAAGRQHPGMAEPLRRTLSKLRGRRSQRGAAAGAGHRHGGVCAPQGKCPPRGVGGAPSARVRPSTCRRRDGGRSVGSPPGVRRARSPVLLPAELRPRPPSDHLSLESGFPLLKTALPLAGGNF